MKNHIFPAIRITLILMLVIVVIYPLIVLLIAKFAPGQGKGETVEYQVSGKKQYGYMMVGQSFTEDKYFNGRPSAVDYNAAGSGGSNKGPSNPDYLATVQARIDSFLVHNPKVSKSQIPVELVTASGSGQDPDISPKAAYIQVERIASARQVSQEQLRKLVTESIEKPFLGILGPERVNVLKLNMALDKLDQKHQARQLQRNQVNWNELYD